MNLRSCAFKDPMILATALLRNGRKDARLIHLGEVGGGGRTRGRRMLEAGSKGSDNWGTRGQTTEQREKGG